MLKQLLTPAVLATVLKPISYFYKEIIMLSKVRKHLKFLPQLFTVLGAVSMAFALMLSVVNMPVSGQGQEVCPSGNGWVKVEPLSGHSYEYTAPDGKLVAEFCYKAGADNEQSGGGVHYEDVDPPASQVTINNKFKPALSHASFRLVDVPVNTPPPPNTPTFTATFTPTNTPVSPTATFTATNTPTNTPIPDDPQPTPTNTAVPEDPEPTPSNTVVPDDPQPTTTPVPDETPEPEADPTLPPPVSNDPPTVLIPVTGVELGGNSPLSDLQNFVFNMGLTFLGLGLILQSVRKRFNF